MRGDCDDNDADNFPGNAEGCDGQDNDCDGATWAAGGEEDGDLDGWMGCLDCDDADPANFPGNSEACDGQDNDCDGATWADGGETDGDLDGWMGCEGDCDDGDAAATPADGDGDGFSTCDVPPDCDDGAALVFPGAPEVPNNGIDEDCDGQDATSACVHLLGRDDSLGIDIYSQHAKGDIDGDGDIDLVVCGTGSNLVLHTNTGSGFTQQSLATVGQPAGIGLGDLDGDGDVDIVHGLNNTGGGRILENDGGVFSDAGIQFGGSDRCDFEFYWIVPIDIDGDSDLELVTGVNCGINVFDNSGGFSFTRTTSPALASGSATQGFATEDIDGDGYPDLVGAVNGGGPSYVFLNDQTGGFVASAGHTLPTTNDGKGTVAADFDGDGDADVFQSDQISGGEVVLTWIENQAGTLVEQTSWSTGLIYGGALDVGDFDGDGDPDVVVASPSGARIYENDGTGAVEPGPQRPEGSFATLVDFEGDGDDDLVVADSGAPPVLYSGGCFDELVAFASTRDGGAAWDVWIADFDQTTFEQLTDLGVLQDHPKISPDGQFVAYQSVESGASQIHLIDTLTLETTQLTDTSNGCASSIQPTWYSDGSAVFYECYVGAGNSRARRVDVTTLTDAAVWDTAGVLHPSLSPDDTQVVCAFDTSSSTPNRRLRILDIASGGVTTLAATQDGHADALPVWMPGGDWIVWSRSDAPAGQGDPSNLYRIEPSGSGMEALTTCSGSEVANYARPSPEGDEIIYAYRTGGHWSIRIVALDGSYDTEWLNETFDSYGPDWRLITDSDGDGHSPPADCDDTDPTVFPNAYESIDGVDNDCDGNIDYDGWGLLSLWDFDSDTSTTIFDATTSANDTDWGGADLVDGYCGNGRQFVAAESDQVTWVDGNFPVITGASPITLSTWIRLDVAPTGTWVSVFSHGATCCPATGLNHTIRFDTGGYPGWSSDDQTSFGDSFFSPAPLAEGGWHHLAGVYDPVSGVRTLYVDGVSVGTATSFSSHSGHAADLVVLAGFLPQLAHRIDATLDMPMVFSTALTEAQVQTLANTMCP